MMATQNFQLLTWDGSKQKRVDTESSFFKLGSLSIGSLAEVKEVGGKLDFGAVALTNLAAPSAASDAATKAYVDAAAASASSSNASTQADLDTLEAAFAQELLDRAAGDASTLASANTYADNKVAALVNGAPAILDTLKEIADSINNNPSIANTLIAQISAVQAEVDAEEIARAAAVSGEATARSAADTALQAEVDAVELALAAETSARTAAESALQADIDAVDAALTAEVTRASGAESVLDGKITTEKNRALSIEAGLQAEIDAAETAIANEVSARTSADASLQAEVDAVETGLAQELLDRADADTLLQSQITNVASDLATEISDREAAIQSVYDSINGLDYYTKENDSGAAVSASKVMYIKANGKLGLADKSLALSDFAVVVSAELINAGQAGLVWMKEGSQMPGFFGLIPGKKCYVDAAGAVTQSLAGFVAGESVYCVGRAISATEIAFAPFFEFEY